MKKMTVILGLATLALTANAQTISGDALGKVSSNCLSKAIEQANKRAELFIIENRNVLNEQDVATILEDSKTLARIEARTCAILESKQK